MVKKWQPSTETDVTFDIVYGSKAPMLPSEMRQRLGPSEVMFVAPEGLEMVRQILDTTLVIHQGIVALAMQRSRCAALLERWKNAPAATRINLQKDVDNGKKFEAKALGIVGDEYSKINSITLVNLCAAIEVSTENAILVILRYRPGVVEDLAAQGVKSIAAPSGRDLTYSEAFAVFECLKKWARKSAKQAPDGTLKMLGAVGLPISLTDETRADLREMIYIRNCILHRSQRADDRASENAAGLGLEEGRRFDVKRNQMGRYANAAMAITSALANASLKPRTSSA